MKRRKVLVALVAFAAAVGGANVQAASAGVNGSRVVSAPQTLTVSLADGPGQVRRYQTCTWRAQASGGTAPYTYTWDAYPGATWTSYSYEFTGSTISSAGYTIEVTVTDANNQSATETRYIQVSTSAPSTCWNP
jgi:hypothetical protein